MALINQISRASWWHILLNGYCTCQSGGKMIDLAALLSALEFG